MYKAYEKYSISSKLLTNPTLVTENNPSKLLKRVCLNDKFDPRKFNEYLEEKITSKCNRNNIDSTKRQQIQPTKYNSINFNQNANPHNQPRNHNLQKFRESRIKQQATSWKKHQSIEKLLGKQNHSIENNNPHNIHSDHHPSSLRTLERKYQQLQEKYKKLMQEAIQEAQSYEATKKQLSKMKEIHFQEQSTLAQLRNQLLQIEEFKDKSQANRSAHVQVDNKRYIIKSKSSEILENDLSAIQPTVSHIQNMWKNKQLEEKKLKKCPMGDSRVNKTSESWSRQNKNITSQLDLKNKQRTDKYYSAEKNHNLSKRDNRYKTNENNTESKTSIKFEQSLHTSKLRYSTKPATETTIRLQKQSSKCITPTTLHKKMISSNMYSKYRFQPSLKLQ